MHTLAVIGVGNMGAALVRGVVREGPGSRPCFAPAEVRVVDRAPELAERLAAELGVVACADLAEAVRGADVILLCVKPQGMAGALAELGPLHEDGAIVISVAAGVDLATLAAGLPRAVVVRAMPNTPAIVLRGASAFALPAASPERARAVAAAILGSVGLALEVPEAHMDAVTALSGSGPAYVFRFLEALVAGGVEAGLDPEVARQLGLQTVLGAAHLAAETGVDPAELRRRVTSPAGTTAAALAVFEQRDLAGTIVAGVLRARDRGLELGRIARGEPA